MESMIMSKATFQYRLLNGFEDPLLNPALWSELQSKGSGDLLFMTWHWQRTWWEVFGRGKLLLILAEKDQQPIAIAPLFADEGMIFFVGSGGSDYLDFVGDISDPQVVEGMLSLALEQVPGFLGCRFYHVPGSSATPVLLAIVAKSKGWEYFDEGSTVCPLLSIKHFPGKAQESTQKKSLLRHEAWFKRNGGISVMHFNKSEDILPRLDEFFEQHIARWEVTPYRSLFHDPLQRMFYRQLCVKASESGFIRFTIVSWQQQVIAFHFGMHYRRCFLWYKPSFDITLAKHSPGEVLLRQLLLNAIDEGADYFDFGLGDEAFKSRFASSTPVVTTVGLYPPTIKIKAHE